MALTDRCETEIHTLHDFFETWFRGELARTNEELARLEGALGAGFRQISPDGTVRLRGAIIDAVETRHGTHRDDDAPFRIEIRAIDPHVERDDLCLLCYEEHQRTEGTWRARRSSALFEPAPEAPGGVVWQHLHETWLEE